ncbi:unnamed protein product [Euphydryas editha]|uniref:Uncharacterized protein n=1 Tax=Euphydryas editha TaxID=104508 RepID=A0AAU9UI04_EUPED|nr:unnamed protein product [Euphydryas editha]
MLSYKQADSPSDGKVVNVPWILLATKEGCWHIASLESICTLDVLKSTYNNFSGKPLERWRARLIGIASLADNVDNFGRTIQVKLTKFVDETSLKGELTRRVLIRNPVEIRSFAGEPRSRASDIYSSYQNVSRKPCIVEIQITKSHTPRP